MGGLAHKVLNGSDYEEKAFTGTVVSVAGVGLAIFLGIRCFGHIEGKDLARTFKVMSTLLTQTSLFFAPAACGFIVDSHASHFIASALTIGAVGLPTLYCLGRNGLKASISLHGYHFVNFGIAPLAGAIVVGSFVVAEWLGDQDL